MNTPIKNILDQNKKKKIYSRIVTNKMSIVAWKLFKSDHQLHFAFIIYRLRRDFGFTAWEIANFTGIPMRQVYKFYEKVKPLLQSEVIKTLSKIDYKNDLLAWNELPFRPGKPQGYYILRKYPAWYEKRMNKKLYNKKPKNRLGENTFNP